MLDTPATIAVLGAGPVGLEAALYARYLGYDVLLVERGSVAAEIERWSRWPLLQPWGACVSKLGLAALHAQDPAWRPLRADAGITAREWCDSYLLPLAQSDLLSDSLREQTEVVSIERCLTSTQPSDEMPEDGEESDGDEETGENEPALPEFLLQVRDARTRADLAPLSAHAVIDATGCGDSWTCLSGSETPLAGETDAGALIATGLRDIRFAERSAFAGRTTIVVGAGLTALANVAALVELAASEPQTRVVWLTPPAGDPRSEPLLATENWRRGSIGPEVPGIAARLTARCSQLQYIPNSCPRAIELESDNGLRLLLAGSEHATVRGQRIINNVALRLSKSRFFTLAPETCPVSGSPLARIAAQGPQADRHLSQTYPQIIVELLTSERHLYVVGRKSFGSRGDGFLLRGGLGQVQALFAHLGGRPALDLYSTMDHLLPPSA